MLTEYDQAKLQDLYEAGTTIEDLKRMGYSVMALAQVSGRGEASIRRQLRRARRRGIAVTPRPGWPPLDNKALQPESFK